MCKILLPVCSQLGRCSIWTHAKTRINRLVSLELRRKTNLVFEPALHTHAWFRKKHVRIRRAPSSGPMPESKSRAGRSRSQKTRLGYLSRFLAPVLGFGTSSIAQWGTTIPGPMPIWKYICQVSVYLKKNI